MHTCAFEVRHGSRRPRLATWIAVVALSACSADSTTVEAPNPVTSETGGMTATGGAATTGGATTTGGAATTGGMAATGGTATTGGAATTGGMAATGGEMPPVEAHMPSCVEDVSDVVMIGDSYVDWITHNFVGDLRAESGQQWPSYAIGGTSMANGGLAKIPEQLGPATTEHPNLHTIVMTGGGNDILVPDTVKFPDAPKCTREPNPEAIPDCKEIVEQATERSKEFMIEAADKGVRDVVYFFYPHIPGGGLLAGAYPNDLLDYALPKAREVCDSSLETTGGRLKCHFVDMVPVFEGKTGLFADAASAAGDGIHPNKMGSKLMAKEIWRVMQENCLGQTGAPACCVEM